MNWILVGVLDDGELPQEWRLLCEKGRSPYGLCKYLYPQGLVVGDLVPHPH